MANQLIGQRLKALRVEKSLSQDEIARLFGFKDRQTVSAIETNRALDSVGAPKHFETSRVERALYCIRIRQRELHPPGTDR